MSPVDRLGHILSLLCYIDDIAGRKCIDLMFSFQPPQQLHDNEGGEEDGLHFGSEVSGC